MSWKQFNFFKYDPTTHDFDTTTFNVKQALNDNWDHAKELIEELRSKMPSAASNDYTDTDKAKVDNLPADTSAVLAKKGNTQTTRVTNVSIQASAWASDATFTDYPYKATLSITGVTATMECKTFLPDHTDADLQYLFAPWVNTKNGGLEVWAVSKPTAEIIIELISFEEVLT